MILTESGMLYSWGYATSGQLGNGSIKNQNVPYPTKNFLPPAVIGYNDFEEKIIQIALGQNHSLARSNAGFVYSCGSSKFGQLGHADFENIPNFTRVMSYRGVLEEDHEPLSNVIKIFAGGNHSWAI